MNIEKYNKYARWYDRERKAAAQAIYAGDYALAKEFEETLKFIVEQMENIKNGVQA